MRSIKRSSDASVARFYSKVLVLACRDACWIWRGAVQSSGYGAFRFDGRVLLAHRFSYEIHIGPIGQGMQIDHRCCRTLCVNPDHLQQVTQQDNLWLQRQRVAEREAYAGAAIRP